LVEREWLQGGHPFADRCSKSAFAITKQRSESPVFLHANFFIAIFVGDKKKYYPLFQKREIKFRNR
jgi:hypothetical protein